jgi:hypothetical protein
MSQGMMRPSPRPIAFMGLISFANRAVGMRQPDIRGKLFRLKSQRHLKTVAAQHQCFDNIVPLTFGHGLAKHGQGPIADLAKDVRKFVLE